MRRGHRHRGVSAAAGAFFRWNGRNLAGGSEAMLTPRIPLREVCGARFLKKGVMRMGSLTVAL